MEFLKVATVLLLTSAAAALAVSKEPSTVGTLLYMACEQFNQ